jgi:hypothetical protein
LDEINVILLLLWSVGSLVYIKSDGDKHKARDRFLVTSVDDESCTVRKFLKSQLRSQQYHLKLSEVYPVLPEEIELRGPIRELDCGRDMEGGDEPQDEYAEWTIPRNESECNRSAAEHNVVVDNNSQPSAAMHMNESVIATPAVDTDVEAFEEATDEVAAEDDNRTLPTGEVVSTDSNRNVNFAVERSRRERSKPKWMSSGDFVIG